MRPDIQTDYAPNVTSAQLKRGGFVWDDMSGADGAWVRKETDGTTTKLGRVGRQYVAVSMTEGDVPTVHRQAQGKTRGQALAGLWRPDAVTLADTIYRGAAAWPAGTEQFPTTPRLMRFTKPVDDAERRTRFYLVEHRGDRLLVVDVRTLRDMIPSTSVYALADLEDVPAETAH